MHLTVGIYSIGTSICAGVRTEDDAFGEGDSQTVCHRNKSNKARVGASSVILKTLRKGAKKPANATSNAITDPTLLRISSQYFLEPIQKISPIRSMFSH